MIEDKPKSMSASNFFIKKTAIKTLIPESTVEAIIKDQWRQVTQAIKSHKYIEHEISGFGQFKTSPAKLSQTLVKLTKGLVKLVDRKEEVLQDPKVNTLNLLESKIQRLLAVIQPLIEKIPAHENRLEGSIKWHNQQDYWRAMDKRRSDPTAGNMQVLPFEFQSRESSGTIPE